MLEKPTSGHIYIDDEDIIKEGVNLSLLREKIGMVFQNFHLFPHMTAIENVMAAPIDLKGKTKQEAYDTAKELLKQIGLLDKALSYPKELSGGQRQRVAIARALAMNPKVLLCDEPTSALDPAMVSSVEKLIKNLKKKNLTIIIVTHEMNLAKNVSDRIFYLDEGIVYEEGTPSQIFNNPQKKNTIDFIHKQKTYQLKTESKYLDFIQEALNIETFCKNQKMPYRLINDIQHVFEEMCVVNIFNNDKISEDIKVLINIEYMTEKNEVIFEVKYDKDKIDIIQTGKEISKDIIKNLATEIKYESIDEDIYTNKIIVKLKE